MEKDQNVQAQLQSLAIARDKRPVATDAPRGYSGKLVVVAFIIIGVAGVAYVSRDKLLPAARNLVAATGNLPEVDLFTVSVTAPPKAGPVLTATGKIVSDHTVSVATKVSGQVVSLHFEQGDTVTKGQLLATIEDIRYRARRDESSANLARARANLAFQEVNFERVAGLMKHDNAQKIEFANARRALDEAAAQVKANEASLAFAQQALTDCEVIAPIGGVILQRNVEVGDFVAAEGGIGANANARFAVIADMSKLRVEVDISELDITRVQKDMPCTITPDAYKDRKYQGYVMWLDPGANYSKATVQAKVRINDADEFLRVDGSAQVAFLASETEGQSKSQLADQQQGIWIPLTAVKKDEAGNRYVFAAEDGRLQKTPVTTSSDPTDQRPDRVRITSGLNPGQRVAKKNTETLRDGMRFAAQ